VSSTWTRARLVVLAGTLAALAEPRVPGSAAARSPAHGRVSGTLTLTDRDGETTSGQAAIFVENIDGLVATDSHPAEIEQRDRRFVPSFTVIETSGVVRFPNRDKVFHNVFSLSRGNEFDLGLYRQGSSKSVRFSQPGVVEVFCNIHQEMVSSILVVQNPYWTRVTDTGRYRLEVPPGEHTLVAWWPRGPAVRHEIVVDPGGSVEVDFTLADSGRGLRHTNKHGQPYGRYK
jgi:plastocyanin